MHSALAALLLALPLSAFAGPHQEGVLRRRHAEVAHSPAYMRRQASYNLVNKYVGEDFLDWNFYTDSDPTHGNVAYQSQQDATNAGLATVDCNNVTTLAVDSTSSVAVGGQRKSVRISSPQTFNNGLFIADFQAMPWGCSVWPAYWSVGANAQWPLAGEIDIIEGVNLNTQNQITLHSGPGCTLNNTAQTEAHVMGIQCASTADSNSGCAYQQSDDRSFGNGFNQAGGGVFAHLWNTDGITFWFFSRGSVPGDITSGNPNPAGWGTPAAIFPNTGCDISSHFYDHSIVLDTTICGDWAGAAYSSSGCPGTCAQAVANATNFANAKWEINSISVYQ
ncbi:hypothetical protein AcV5_008972 [Taiwanofungus camphoratus]|nr:hypothetical protein AcV5_008972 [Antrodia cinnamomea]